MADMSVAQIIKNEFRINPFPGVNSAEEYAYAIKKAVDDGCELIHSGNYLFLCKEIGNGVVDIMVLEGKKSDKDSLNNLFKALLQLRQSGYKEANIPFDDKNLINLLKKLPVLPVSFEQADDGYVAKVRLA